MRKLNDKIGSVPFRHHSLRSGKNSITSTIATHENLARALLLISGRGWAMIKNTIVLFLVICTWANAELFEHGGGVVATELDQAISDLEAQIQFIPPEVQVLLAQQLKVSDQRLHRIIARLEGMSGQWIQTEGQECNQVCNRIGKVNAPSIEGALCVSGERRVASARNRIQYTKGTWGEECRSITTNGSCAASSHNRYCYAPGQKHDTDKTDITVGCFCR